MIHERGFEEQFCKMVSSCIDLDTHEDHPVFFDVQTFSRKCDFYKKICNTECLRLSFSRVLIRMYNLEVLLDLDLTLEDRKKLIETVYVQALDLIYQFLGYKLLFFYEFYGKFSYEYHKNYCFSVPTIIKHHGPYNG